MSDRDNTTGSDQTKIVGLNGLSAMVKGKKLSKPKIAFKPKSRKHLSKGPIKSKP